MCDGWLQISVCRDFMINHPLKVPFLQGIHLLRVPCWGLLGVLVSGCLVGELQSQEATPDDPQAFATPRAPSEVDPQQVLEASMRLFDDGFFHAAKQGFVDWLLQFPDHASTSRVREFALWATAEDRMQKGQYKLATDDLSQLLEQYPESQNRLNYAFREAWVLFRMEDYENALARLIREDQPFQEASRQSETSGDPGLTLTRLRGRLLLAETYLKMKDFEQAKRVLDAIPDWSLSDELVWRREFVLTQLQLAEENLIEARQSATRLLAWARSIDSAEWISESVALKGDVLQANGQYDAALATYEQNLSSKTHVARRRQARLKMVELGLLMNQSSEVLSRLESMLEEPQPDASLDVVLLTMGEIRLKQYFGSNEVGRQKGADLPSRDLLVIARGHLEQMLRDYPQSAYYGRALYALGWCFWEQEDGAQSMDAFAKAKGALPLSMEHAESLFKQGDLYLIQGDARRALGLYHEMQDTYQENEEVRAQLFDQLLYQSLKAAITAEDVSAASRIAEDIIQHYPSGPFTQRSQLMLGQELMHIRKLEEARSLFMRMLERFDDFASRPLVELSVARSYELEGDWAQALVGYNQWLEQFSGDSREPEVLYGRAWLEDRLGKTSEAMEHFQIMLKAFPHHPNALLASNWIGDHYFNQGDFSEAEAAYGQVIAAKADGSESHSARARLMLAKCRFYQNDYEGVLEHLSPLLEDAAIMESMGKDFMAEVFLCQGDAQFAFARTTTPYNPVALGRASNAYTTVYAVHRPNRWEPLAWGRRGDLLYFSGEDYQEAINAYEEALKYEYLNIGTRSQLAVSLGLAKERLSESEDGTRDMAMETEALNHYLHVVYQKNLKRGEVTDAFWLREAGIRAMAILERQDNWVQAKAFTDYLSKLLPSQEDEWLQMMQQWQGSLPQLPPSQTNASLNP